MQPLAPGRLPGRGWPPSSPMSTCMCLETTFSTTSRRRLSPATRVRARSVVRAWPRRRSVAATSMLVSEMQGMAIPGAAMRVDSKRRSDKCVCLQAQRRAGGREARGARLEAQGGVRRVAACGVWRRAACGV